MNFGKKTLIYSALTASFAIASSAQAFTFNAGGIETINDVAIFDWAVSNALAVGGTGNAAGDTFQLLSHGALSAYQRADASVIGGTGVGSSYEITYVTSFQEQVTTSVVSGNFAAQGFVTTGAGVNFFDIYFDDTPDSNNQAGTGFNNGQLIASGVIIPGGVGSFVINDITVIQDLDQTSDGNQFDGVTFDDIDSVVGGGQTSFEALVAFGFYDTDFFVGGISDMGLNFSTKQALPFTQVNPALAFVDAQGLNVAPTQAGATIASVGTINGLSGPNLVLEVDASSTIDFAVPVPAPLALFGLGLVGLGLVKRSKAKAV